MQLSTKGRYAVAAMVDLAEHHLSTPITLADIAARQKLPLSYLEQLFYKLKKAGLVKGFRGQMGGYLLAKTSLDISIADIMKAVDEPLRATGCKENGISCKGDGGFCQTHDLWKHLGHHIETYLKSISLKDVYQKNFQPLG